MFRRGDNNAIGPTVFSFSVILALACWPDTSLLVGFSPLIKDHNVCRDASLFSCADLYAGCNAFLKVDEVTFLCAGPGWDHVYVTFIV